MPLLQRQHRMFRPQPVLSIGFHRAARTVFLQVRRVARQREQCPLKTAQHGSMIRLGAQSTHHLPQSLIQRRLRVFSGNEFLHQFIYIQPAQQRPALRLRPAAQPFDTVQCFQFFLAIPGYLNRHKRHQHAA